jgi:hypothetical protein
LKFDALDLLGQAKKLAAGLQRVGFYGCGAPAGLVTSESSEGLVCERSVSPGTILPFPFIPSSNFWPTSAGVCSVTLQASKKKIANAKQMVRKEVIRAKIRRWTSFCNPDVRVVSRRSRAIRNR